MTTGSTEEIVLAWITAWAGPDLDTLEALAAPGYVHHAARDGNLATFKQGITVVNRTLEGYSATVDQLVAAGPDAAVRWTGAGVFRESFMGFAATQQPAKMHGVTFFHVEHGRIETDWETLDILRFRLSIQA